MRTLKNFVYFIRVAVKSLAHNRWMSLASIGVVSVTLLLLGIFIVVNYNVDLFTRQVKEQVEIVVYVKDANTPEVTDALRMRIIEIPEIQEVLFVTKREALERLKESFGDKAYLLEGYDDDALNPLRDSFEIKTAIPEDIAAVAQRIEGFVGVDWVDYGEDFLERLFIVTKGVKSAVFIFAIVLGLTALFLISNTIKLAVFSRSDEIMIMKYVGATDWFIRWPFLFEGMIMGFLGAVIPLIILNYGYGQMVDWLQTQVMFLAFVPPQMVMDEVIRVLIPMGVVIGGVGSMFSTHRFLKV
jgi:cell division transport system permease protein